MIKLKSILREAGLLSEQNNSQLITITDTDTIRTIQDKLTSVDGSKLVNLELGKNINLNNDAIPTDADKQNVINQINLLQSISSSPLEATVNGTTSTPPASPNAPGAILTPDGATEWERWVNDNTPNNRIQITPGSSNNNLAIRRAAAMAEAAAEAGIPSANIKIGNVNTTTQRTASITITGKFPPAKIKPQFTFEVAVRIPNQTELRSGSAYTIPFYVKKGYNVKMPGTWATSGTEANFKVFVSKVASGKNWSGSGLNDKRFATIDPTTFAKFQTLNRLISKIDIIDYLRTNAAELSEKSFLEPWSQDTAAIGIDNVIKLFSE
tara:strand:+ start:421 stop:1392 length:972 start_codon:yes stop_codon:yes gene_type:complete